MGYRNVANALRRGTHCVSVCSLAGRPKFRREPRLLVPAYKFVNNYG